MDSAPVIGFVGTGHIATFHSKMLRRCGVPHTRGPVFDIDPARATAFAEASGSTVVSSEQEVVDGSDLVYICTWTSEHARLVDMCIAAGKPFFCEKPLSTGLAGAARMTQAAVASGLTHQCGLVLRRSPAYLWARELIADPASGGVMAVVFRDDQFIPTQGHYRSTWRGDVSKAGAGTLLEHSIHDVDMLRFLVGDVADVSARATYAHGIEGIEDVVASSVRFSNGAVGTLTTIWHDNLSRPSLRHVEVFCHNRTVVIAGDDWFGPVTWSDADGTTGSLGGEDLVERTAPLAVGDANPDGAFVRAATDGEPGYPDFAVALAAHRVVEAMYESCRSGGSAVSVSSGPS
ncbi:MAG: gfo/Idh/MocA family oxidoreductase [Actinobacteria bacterium]|nr:gfo/Idh/MocA family oxidoreductase [Actinomycetota bacterium]NBR66266.1 gfo/Idh/MocA family oxidoreductase [Actinomycetota bacterium]NBU15607.1 gfo/Idh/MocA family oxidoreductase [Actinomycetota bacterium]